MSSFIEKYLFCCNNNSENLNTEINNNNLSIKKNSNNIYSKDNTTTEKHNNSSHSKKIENNPKQNYSFISYSYSNKNNNKNDSMNNIDNNNNNYKIIINKDNLIKEKNSFSIKKKFQTTKNIYLTNEMFLHNDNGDIISNISSEPNEHFENSSIKNLTEIFTKTFDSTFKKNIKTYKPLLYELNNNMNLNSTTRINNMDNIILDDEIEYAPKLLLTEIKKSNIFFHKKIHINASGSKESLKNTRDGKTYFGLDIENDDILINIENNSNNDDNNLNKTFFAILYDRNKSNYFIENLNNQKYFFLYIKIYHEYYINEKKTHFFLLGITLMSIKIIEDDEIKSINIRIYNNNNLNDNSKNKTEKFKEYIFSPNNYIFSIGRENSSININNKYISRIHCTIIYDKFNNKWLISDGNGKSIHSTHGVWYILTYNNKFELKNNNENYEVKIEEKNFNIAIKE